MSTRGPWAEIARQMGGRLTFDCSLEGLSAYGSAIRAKALAKVEQVEELKKLITLKNELDCPLYILGGGSNTIFVGPEFKGLVIKLGKKFQEVSDSGDALMRAGAAAPTSLVLETATTLGYAGLEGLVGIPGCFGGALVMNAGSYGFEIGSVVERLWGLDGQGVEFTVYRDSITCHYRHLFGLPDEALVLGAELRLQKGLESDIRQKIRDNLSRRGTTQPKGWRSAGSVFKNPPGCSAGRIIEECGYKGLALGGARVSEVHANFIVAQGPIDGSLVLELINIIRAGVFEKLGIALEPEVKIVGPLGLMAPIPLEVKHVRS